MTKAQLLLICLMEECDEVSQRAAKALRFGLEEVQEGQPLDNADRIVYEFNDLLAVMERLAILGLIPTNFIRDEMIASKNKKLDQWLEYSEQRGAVESSPYDDIKKASDYFKSKGQTHSVIKCNCPCHVDKNYKHVAPCCENGYITL